VPEPQVHRCAEGWICEEHPDLEWPHPKLRPEDGMGADCAGPGMPRQCPGCPFVAAWTKGREP
jgi:hypothetical protein